MPWLLLGLAWALPFRLEPSPGSRVEVLPQVEPGRTEVLIQDNRVDLNAQIGTTERPGIRAWRMLDLGTSWVVNVWLRDPGTRLELVPDGEGWVGVIKPSSVGDATADVAIHSVEALVALPAGYERCTADARSPLTPLGGADMLHAFEPEELLPDLPRWTDAEPERGMGWAALDEVHRALPRVTEAGERARLYYSLGAVHRDHGHAREAAHYFGRAAELGAPDGLAHLQRAGALLRARMWPDARAEAVRAVRAGAPESAAYEVLGVSTLMGGDGAAAPIGRVLARKTARPTASLVAGALLMRDRCAAEAIPVLERTRLLVGARDAMGRILLADAMLTTGGRDAAVSVLGTVANEDVPERWRGPLRARRRLAALLGVTADQWPAFMPSLSVAADRWDDEGLEVLFLLGQMGEVMGDSRQAHDAYVALVDRHRAFATGEPGRRLLAVWRQRTGELLAAGRTLDAVSFHVATWRTSMLPIAEDVSLLRTVGEKALEHGLHEEALSVFRDVAALEGARGLDDRRTLLALADVYRASGRAQAALDTLDFFANRPRDPALSARAGLLRARTLEVTGQRAVARDLYAGLSRGRAVAGSVAAEARLRGALVDVDDGQCARALPVLGDVTEFPADLSPGLVGIARSRCLFASGRVAEARAAAAMATNWLSAPQVGAYADYLARLGAPVPSGPVPGAEGADPLRNASPAAAPGAAAPPATLAVSGEAKGVWARLLEEEKADAELRARLPKTLVRK